MAEGYSIDFGRFAVGLYRHLTGYGRTVVPDGTVYQLWRFYVWVKA